MSFGNNIEAMASEKSGWAIIDQSADGSVIYMGKPVSDTVKLSENAWLIKKITTTTNDDGSQIIKTQYAEPRYKCAWNERKNLEYMPKFEEEPEKFLEEPYRLNIMYRNIEEGTEEYYYDIVHLYRKNESDTLRDCLNYPINGATRIANGYDMGDYILHDYAIDDRWGLVKEYGALPIIHKDIPSYSQYMELYTTDDIAPDGTNVWELDSEWKYSLDYRTDANMSWYDWLHSDYVDDADFTIKSVDSSTIQCGIKVFPGWNFTMDFWTDLLTTWTEAGGGYYWEVWN